MGGHHRFFVDPECITDGTATIAGDTARQIVKVLRLREGAVVNLLDGQGNEYSALIAAVERDKVVARVLGPVQHESDPTVRVTLAVYLPKGDKLDLIVQKCTELGISQLIAVESERTVARLNREKAAERMARWRRIAAEAAEQSGRASAPECVGVMAWDDLPETIGAHSRALVAWEEEGSVTLKSVLRGDQAMESVFLAIGPEGGLTQREIDIAREAGATTVSLGRRLLRAETAAIAACAAIMYELED